MPVRNPRRAVGLMSTAPMTGVNCSPGSVAPDDEPMMISPLLLSGLAAVLVAVTAWIVWHKRDPAPIRFVCRSTVAASPQEIFAQILDLEQWPTFGGYGFLPGIRRAAFESRSPGEVGTVIQVENTDGSRHREEILEWQPERRMRLRLFDFSPPLSRLAICFDETWELTPEGDATGVTRAFTLYPRSRLARLPLWLISRLLARAVTDQLRRMGRAV